MWYRGSAGGGCSAQGGTGTSRVHSAVFGDVQSPVQVLDVHQRVKLFGFGR